MNRRSWIKAMAAAAASATAIPALKSALQCGPAMPPVGMQSCSAGIPQDQLNMVFADQEASEWCWAACIQMVFSFWGHPVSQQEIVRQTWGVAANVPAHPLQIMNDLNRLWRDANGRPFRAVGDVFTATGATAAQDLANNMPLIIGSMGHAMVLTAMSYNRMPNSAGQVTKVMVRDPWPGNGGTRPLSPVEAASTMLLARIRVM